MMTLNCVLCTENFGTDFRDSIRDNDEIVSATRDGRIPFISSEDIAQAAFEALMAEKSPNRDYYVLGPELYSYDEVCKKILRFSKRITEYIDYIFRPSSCCPQF